MPASNCDPCAESATPTTPAPAPRRSELALEGRAARQCWPIPEAKQAAIVAGLVAVATGEGRPRTKITAARALAQFGRLSLDQQKLDAAEAPPAEPTGDRLVVLDVRDVLLHPEVWAQAVRAIEAASAAALEEGQRRAALTPAARDAEWRAWADAPPRGPCDGATGPGGG